MNIVETVRATRLVLDRRTRRTLAWATVATVLISLLDTLAIAMVLPLVTLASGGSDSSTVGRLVDQLLGSPDQDTLVVILAASVVVLFILKDLGAIAYTWWLTGFKVLKRVELSTRRLQTFSANTLHRCLTTQFRRTPPHDE